MTAKKSALAVGLVPFLLLPFSGCKKSPTTPSIETEKPTIEVLCEPSSGGGNSTVTVKIAIAGNTKEMRVFGLDLSFDVKMFQFQGVQGGSLTGSWAAVDGNEINPGSLKVGGFVGGGTPISEASRGTLAEIKFKVTGSEYGNGQQSQLCTQQYTDDLTEFQPGTACASFTLQK